MAGKAALVEVHLGVQGDEVSVSSDGKGVHLDLGCVLFHCKAHKGLHYLDTLPHLLRV